MREELSRDCVEGETWRKELKRLVVDVAAEVESPWWLLLLPGCVLDSEIMWRWDVAWDASEFRRVDGGEGSIMLGAGDSDRPASR